MDYRELTQALGTHKNELKAGVASMLFPAILSWLLYIAIKNAPEIESPSAPFALLVTNLVTFFICYITIEAAEKEQKSTQTIAKRIGWSTILNTFFLFPIIGSIVGIILEIAN